MTINGKVSNPRGDPIAGVAVYWQYGVSTTASDGRYTITVWAEAPLTLVADANLYDWQSRYIENPIVASALPQDFTLRYALRTAVSPSAFNNSPTKTLTFSTYSTVPVAGTRMIIQLPSGSTLDLAHDVTYSDPQGYRSWSRTWTVPSGTTDGAYIFKACALDQLALGTCDQPLGLILSQVKGGTFIVDGTPPVFSFSSPTAFSNTLSLGSVTVGWADPLSGLDAVSLSLTLDGSPLPGVPSGGSITASISGLTPGIHLIEATARDLAGNQAVKTFIFTLVALTQDSATATLQQTTVQVNPNAQIPPPSTVRFVAPRVQVPGFGEELNASTWVGHGTVSRGFAFGAVNVVFSNETGIPTTVNVPVPAGAATHRLGILAPSGDSLSTSIAPTASQIPDVVVDVPAGYNTLGSTATLQAASTSLDSTPASSGQFLASTFVGPVTVNGHISACIHRHPSGNYLACEQSSVIRANVQALGQIYVPRATGLQAPLDTAVEVQQPICDGCANGPQTPPDILQARFALGCVLYSFQPVGVQENLCDLSTTAGQGYFRSYLNGWVFTNPTATDVLGNPAAGFPFWQQNHSETARDRCPNGTSGSGVTATISRGVSNALAFDGASDPLVAGSWNGPLPFYVRLGATTGPTEASTYGEPVYSSPGRSYQLTHTFNITPKSSGYTILRGSQIDEFGNVLGNPTAVANAWEGEGTESVQLVTGADYRPTAVGGFAYRGTLAFQFTALFDCG